MYIVDTMEKCNKYLEKLRVDSRKLWQMQYGYNDPNGFHAWFWMAEDSTPTLRKPAIHDLEDIYKLKSPTV